MRKLRLVPYIVGVAGIALAAAGVMAQEAEQWCDMTGEILSMDRANSTIELEESEDDSVTLEVDPSAVPRWATDFKVGDEVAVTCKFVEEQGHIVVSITMVRQKKK